MKARKYILRSLYVLFMMAILGYNIHHVPRASLHTRSTSKPAAQLHVALSQASERGVYISCTDNSFPSTYERYIAYAGGWHNFTFSKTDLLTARRELCEVSKRSAAHLIPDKVFLLTKLDLELCDASSGVSALRGGRYCRDALAFFEIASDTEHMLVSFGDITPGSILPHFVKTRPTNATQPNSNHGNGILWPLNVRRHFGGMKDFGKTSDTVWDNKLARLVWRGAETGSGQRAKAAEEYYFAINEGIDIALTLIINKEHQGLNSFTRPTLSMQEILKNKFLLSLEGNDVSSGLKWMLLSDSVVFMPTPKYMSWALEVHLLPFVHYIPVLEDLSDLRKKVHWARKNDLECQRIAEQATKFMHHFLEYAVDSHHLADRAVKTLLVNAYARAMLQITTNFTLQDCGKL
jgi:hypothetical protein